MRFLAALSVLMVAACDGGVADRPAAQPLARVNGVEIFARQASAPNMSQALEKVIERELLAQKALAAGLDNDPAVAEAIDAARRQVLAQAYVERAAAGLPKPTRDEVRAFYDENPALFAERRIYRVRELAVSAPAEMVDVLRAETAQAKELEEVAAWLKSRNARYSATTYTQPAEQLPLAFLPRMARMKPGEIAVFATPLGASVIQLIHAEEAPLGLAEANGLIEQFLAGRRRLEFAEAEVKRLREGARIEYVAQLKR